MPDLDRDFAPALAQWTAGRRPRLQPLPRRRRPTLSAPAGLPDARREPAPAAPRRRPTALRPDGERSRSTATPHACHDVLGGSTGAGPGAWRCSAPSEAGLWEDVGVPRPLARPGRLGRAPARPAPRGRWPRPTVLLHRHRGPGTGPVPPGPDGAGRRGGRDVLDEVPGRHDQGGWSQARYQRHIEEHVGQPPEARGRRPAPGVRGAGVRPPDPGGPRRAVVPEFERRLHDYLQRRIAARVTLPMTGLDGRGPGAVAGRRGGAGAGPGAGRPSTGCSPQSAARRRGGRRPAGRSSTR